MDRKARLAIIFFCGLPTLAVVQRFAQVVAPTIALHAGIMTAFLLTGWSVLALLILKYASQALESKRQWRIQPDTLFLICLLGLIVLQVLVYPLSDSGQLGFYSDRDEAIDIGARRLLAGEHPYTCRAVSGIHHGCPIKGNPILPLPGSMVLSIPFMFTGGSATQVFLWLAILYVATRTVLQDSQKAFIYQATIFTLSPILLAEILTGGDLISNTLAVSTFTLITLNAKTLRGQLLFGFLLGVALSWRAHFLLITFPLAAFYVANNKTAEFAKIASATILGFAIVTLPVYLWDTAVFTPTQSSEKLSDFADIMPHASTLVPSLAAAAGILLGARAKSLPALLNACGITVILPVLAAILLNSISTGHPTLLFYGWYTLSGLVFGTIAAILPTELSARATEFSAQSTTIS